LKDELSNSCYPCLSLHIVWNQRKISLTLLGGGDSLASLLALQYLSGQMWGALA